jgi:hypothetical protein
MAKGKELPAIDFHAVVARRDPALAERLAREGIATAPVVEEQASAPTPPPALVVVPPAPEPETIVVQAAEPKPAPRPRVAPQPTATKAPSRKRGVVQRATGEVGRVTVYVPTELALRLRKYCFERDRTISDVAGELLIEALERHLRSA